ncbi:hypothetical protein CDL15_Pgr019268 [Punica granatum]|uniref:Uncharacterized protein n=1 Tax=Punica granatum TaxID=22663 RepID=A0A218Y249_PUNGR|nr:hypothetical protein CDL15_Pgr019268 [Punica granatum]
MDRKSWTRYPKSGKDGHEVLDAKSEKLRMETRSPRRIVRKAVKTDTKSWTRSTKSGKDGHEVQDAKSEKRERWTPSPGRKVRKAVKMDTKSDKR